MNLVKRTVTAAVLLGILFVIVQYAPRAVFFLFGQVFIVAALLEFYSLNAKKDLAPQKALGVGPGAPRRRALLLPRHPSRGRALRLPPRRGRLFRGERQTRPRSSTGSRPRSPSPWSGSSTSSFP